MIKQLLTLLQYLDTNDRIKLIRLQILIIINGFFQTCAIFSIGPLISILADEKNFFEQISISINLDKYTHVDLLLFFSIIVLFLFFIANFLTAYIYSQQQKICQYIGANICVDIAEKFNSQKFINQNNKNTSTYKSIIEKEVNTFVGTVLMPISELNGKIVPLLIILSLIFFLNPEVTLIIFFILGSGYFLLFIIVKKKLYQNSRIISKTNFLVNKYLNEILNSWVENKIFNLGNILLNNFENQKIENAKSSSKNLILQVTPKFFFEILAVLCVVIFIFYFAKFKPNYYTLTYLSIYVAAGYKIMPYMQSILFAFSSVKGSHKTIELILKYLKIKNEKIKYLKESTIYSIKLSNVSLSMQSKEILKNINIIIKRGDIVCVKGETGTGKTTLINILLGFLNNYRGKIYINGNKTDKKNFNLFNVSSYVPQKINILNDTLISNIALKRTLTKKERNKLLKILKILKLNKFIAKNKIKNLIISENGRNLSSGQVQRIGIARALFKDFEVIFLDEFTSNLDIDTEKVILKNLFSSYKNKIFFIVSHRPVIEYYCNKVFVLKNKKLKKIK